MLKKQHQSPTVTFGSARRPKNIPSAGALSTASSSPKRLTIRAMAIARLHRRQELDARLRQEQARGRRQQRLLRALGAVGIVLRFAGQHLVVPEHVEHGIGQLAADFGEGARRGRGAAAELDRDPDLALLGHHGHRISLGVRRGHDAAPARPHRGAELDRFRPLVDEHRLGQIGMRAARVDRDLHVGDLAHPFRMRPGDALGEIAVRAAGIDPVHVVAEGVERVAAACGLIGRHVDDGNQHERAGQRLGLHLAQQDLAAQRAFRLVAMDGAVDPEHGAGLCAVDHDDGDLDGRAARHVHDRDRATAPRCRGSAFAVPTWTVFEFGLRHRQIPLTCLYFSSSSGV